MSYATLMVHLELGRPNAALLRLTGDLAARLHASVIGVAACQPMRIIYNDGYVPANVIEQERQQVDDEMKAAEAELRAALAPRLGSVDWRSAVIYSSLSEYLAQQASCADLIITGVEAVTSLFDTSHHVDIGDFVMRAGRPCLIVPTGTDHLALDHVVAGWKDSREARIAVRDALPLLQVADKVTVVEIASRDETGAAQVRLAEVVGWLERHGIHAAPVVATSIGDDAAQLSNIVEDQGADLLVAGAYGHSRVREWAMGGVTRSLLLRSKRCSLVSH